MPNSYLEGKIKKYDRYKIGAVVILIAVSFFVGKIVTPTFSFLSIITAISMGGFGALVLLFIEHYINKQSSYKRGLDLEEQIAKKLDGLKDVKYEPHLETDYGDLDFLISKNGSFWGVEAKNWPGVVIFENGMLKVNNFDNSDILNELLKHCLLVRNKEFGENSGKYIKPMLVFGHKTNVNIPQNKIFFNKVEITITTIKDFEKFI